MTDNRACRKCGAKDVMLHEDPRIAAQHPEPSLCLDCAIIAHDEAIAEGRAYMRNLKASFNSIIGDWREGERVNQNRKTRWRVADHNGETVFDADSIHNDPVVRGGLYTARDWARKLAKENTDPEAPPLTAVKDAS